LVTIWIWLPDAPLKSAVMPLVFTFSSSMFSTLVGSTPEGDPAPAVCTLDVKLPV